MFYFGLEIQNVVQEICTPYQANNTEGRKQKEEEGGMISHTALCAVGSVILGQTFKRESCSELECILEYGSFGKAYILVPAFSEFIEDLPLFVVQLLFQVLAICRYTQCFS